MNGSASGFDSVLDTKTKDGHRGSFPDIFGSRSEVMWDSHCQNDSFASGSRKYSDVMLIQAPNRDFTLAKACSYRVL